jgi:hypothetical protein
MGNTISGNVFANTGQGDSDNAIIQCTSAHIGSFFQSQSVASVNGAYSFTGLIPGTYILSANTGPITSGPHVGWLFRPRIVVIDPNNPQDQTNINFSPIAPTALNPTT